MIPIIALKPLEATGSSCVVSPCTRHHFKPLLFGLVFGYVLIKLYQLYFGKMLYNKVLVKKAGICKSI